MRTKKSISSYNRILKLLCRVCFKDLFLVRADSILVKRGGLTVGFFITYFCALCPEDFCQVMYSFLIKLIHYLAVLLLLMLCALHHKKLLSHSLQVHFFPDHFLRAEQNIGSEQRKAARNLCILQTYLCTKIRHTRRLCAGRSLHIYARYLRRKRRVWVLKSSSKQKVTVG